MASFSKKKIFLFLMLAIVLLGLALILFNYTNSKKETVSSFSQTKKMLENAKAEIARNPELAESTAQEALTLATSMQDKDDMICAWILLGKINNIKGKTNAALDLYTKAQAIAQQENLLTELCEVSVNIGEIKYKHGEYHKALKDFLYADSVAAKNNFEQLRSYTLYYIGKYNQTTGKFSEANRYYQQALSIAREHKDKQLLTLILPSLGKYYLSEGKLHLALQSYLEALDISKQMNDYLLNADICNHLGGLYLQMNEYNKALEFHKKALEFRNEMNNPEGLAKSYNNIGRAYVELQQLDSAYFYFKKSLQLCQNVDYKKGMIKAQINIGKVYVSQYRPKEAKQFLLPAFHLSSHISYDVGFAESSLAMGNLYKDARLLDTAIYYYKLSLEKLFKTNYDEELRDIYQGLYECYNFKEDYNNALHYHRALLEEEKKLLNVDNNRQLAMLNIAYDTERKEKDYQVLVKDNALKESLLTRKNTAMWLVIVALGFTILLCLYIYNRFYIKKKANQQLEALNQQVIKQNGELEKLNKELAQVSEEKDKLFSIISHELRNPLYWLQNLAEALSQKYLRMSPEKIKKTLSSLDESAKNVYHLMDNLLYWSRSKLNRIHPRKANYNLHSLICESTQMYESFLQQKEITLQNFISKNINIYVDTNLFACVIRNLISNAIKYTPNEGRIDIHCELSEGSVIVVVSDSGKGISNEHLKTIFEEDKDISMPGLMQEKGSGLGLKLCKDFVEMNGGTIWAQSSKDKGTQFFFTVPLTTLLKIAL